MTTRSSRSGTLAGGDFPRRSCTPGNSARGRCNSHYRLGSRMDSWVMGPLDDENLSHKIVDQQLMEEQTALRDEQEAVARQNREYDPLPWWKRIILDPDYRATMIYEASKCYEEELQVLHFQPELLSSSQAMTPTQVMAQYVGLRAHQKISMRHPHLIIKHSKLETLRRVALNNMPPARDSAHHRVQTQAIEDYLIHRRRLSLTRSCLAKRIKAQRILAGKDPIPPLPITEVYNVPPPAENDAAFSDNLVVTTPPLSPLSELRVMVERSRKYKEEEEARQKKKDERDTGGIPVQMLDTTNPNRFDVGDGFLSRRRRRGSLEDTNPFSDAEQLEALNAAKSCIDGMDNLYGLSYYWDQPLPPAGFIRSSPDPRHAMWPDDFREESRRRAKEKRKANTERKIQMVNEQNKKRRFLVELGLHVNPLQFITPDDADGETEDLEEAEHIRRKIKEDSLLKPIYSGPLNINIFVEPPEKSQKTKKSSTSSVSHTDGGDKPEGSVRDATSNDESARTHQRTKKRRKMIFAGTYRQSLMLIHYKNYARALHLEEDRRLRGPMARVGGQLEDPETVANRLAYHEQHSKRLVDVPRFQFPVLKVQSASPPLKDRNSLKTVDTSNIPPAACWEGLCPSSSPDSTHTSNNAWRHLQCTSMLARQAVQDIFNCLEHDPDKNLDKRAFVGFVLDLLHLFFPTYHQHIHVAIAEEEWVFRGTTENVRFETFFQKFFSWPFIFMRDISLVHEQEYVEFWSLVRIALFESVDNTPTLIPFTYTEQDYRLEGTITSSRTPEEAQHLQVRVLWRREGMDFTRSIRLQPKPGTPQGSAPTRSPRLLSSTKADASEVKEEAEERHHHRQPPTPPLDSQTSASSFTRKALPPLPPGAVAGTGGGGDRLVNGSPPPPAALSTDAGSGEKPTGGRRASLLVPFTTLKPVLVYQLYCSNFHHPEDYDLVLIARHVAATDPLIPHLPSSHREAVIRARAHELLEVCQLDDERVQLLHQRALEERERQLRRVGAELTLTLLGSQKFKLEAIREEVLLEMGRSTNTGGEPAGGESRSAQVLRLEKERRAIIDRLELERNKFNLLKTSLRHQDRQRRIHAQYSKAASTVESMASAWELHYDDVFETVNRPPDVEDGLIAYVADVEEDMFTRNVSLRERYLVHEAYKRERQLLLRRGRAEEPSRSAFELPTEMLAKQLECDDGPLRGILAPYRGNAEDTMDHRMEDILGGILEGSLSTLEHPDEPNRLPYPPRKLSMAPLMDPRVMEHLYLTSMKSNPTAANAITGCTDKYESFVTGAYPLHPTEGKGPERAPGEGGPTHTSKEGRNAQLSNGTSSLQQQTSQATMQSSDTNPISRRHRFTPNGSMEEESRMNLVGQPSGSSCNNYHKMEEIFIPPITLLQRDRPEVNSVVYEVPPRHIRNRNDFGGLNVDGPAAQRHLYQVREQRAQQYLTNSLYRAHFHTSRDVTSTWAGDRTLGSPLLPDGNSSSQPGQPLADSSASLISLSGSRYPQHPSYCRPPPQELDWGLEGNLDSIVGSIPILPTADRRKIGGISENVVMTLRRMRKEKPPPSPTMQDFRDEEGGQAMPVGALEDSLSEEQEVVTEYNLDPPQRRYPGVIPPFSKATIDSYAPSTKNNLYGLGLLSKGGGINHSARIGAPWWGQTSTGAGVNDTLGETSRSCRFDESNRAVEGDHLLHRTILEELQREEAEATQGGASYEASGSPELVAWGTFNGARFDVAAAASAAALRLAGKKPNAGTQAKTFKVNPRALASSSYSEAYLMELNLLLGIREEDEEQRNARQILEQQPHGMATGPLSPEGVRARQGTGTGRLHSGPQRDSLQTMLECSLSCSPPLSKAVTSQLDGSTGVDRRTWSVSAGTLHSTNGGPAPSATSTMIGGCSATVAPPVNSLGVVTTTSTTKSSESEDGPVPLGRLFRSRRGLGGLGADARADRPRLTAPGRATVAEGGGAGNAPSVTETTADVDLHHRLVAQQHWNEQYCKKYHPDMSKRFVNSTNSKKTFKAKVPTNLWARLSHSSGWTSPNSSSSGSAPHHKPARRSNPSSVRSSIRKAQDLLDKQGASARV